MESVSPEQMAVYRTTARRRMAKRNAELDARFGRARQTAGSREYAALANRIEQKSDWHSALLLQMSGATHGVRPKVIRYDTRVCLDEYRRFRHIVRDVYTFNLRPSHLDELTQELRACFNDLHQDLTLFASFLNDLAHTED